MLLLTETYIDSIREIGEDPQLFPLSPAGGFGSAFSFSSDFASLTFADVVVDVFTIDKYSPTIASNKGSIGNVLTNLTPGSSSSFITSLASHKLKNLKPGKTFPDILNARATQLWNETGDTTEALVINANPTLASVVTAAEKRIEALVAKYNIKVVSDSQTELTAEQQSTNVSVQDKSTKIKLDK